MLSGKVTTYTYSQSIYYQLVSRAVYIVMLLKVPYVLFQNTSNVYAKIHEDQMCYYGGINKLTLAF